MKISLRNLFVTAFLILSAVSVEAQEYNIRHFHPENGLNGTYVYTTIEDSRGYKWVGTDFSLARFDGQNFENIDINDSTRTKFTTSSLSKENGNLLFGYYNGVIKEYNGVDLKTIYQPVGNTSPIRSMISDGGKIWALTQNKGIIKIENGEAKRIILSELLYRKSTIATLFNDRLLIGTNEGILIYYINDGELEYSGDVATLNNKSVQTINSSIEENTLWVGTDGDGIFQLKVGYKDNVLNINSQKVDFLGQESVVSIKESNNSDLWIGTKYHGLIKVNFNKDNSKPIQFTSLNPKNGFPANQISTLFFDKDKNIWAGTTGAGLVQVTRKGILFYNFEKFRTKSIFGITSTSKHEYFFGSDVGLIKGSYKGTEDSLTFQMVKHKKLDREAVTALYTDEDDIIYYAVKNKGIFYGNSSFTDVKELVFDHQSRELHVRQITEDKEGNLWISVMHNGIFVVDKSGTIKKHYATKTGFFHNEIYHIHLDSKGNKWFAAHSAGLAIENAAGEITYLSRTGAFPARDVNDISEDEAGNIWIGTYGNGIYEYDGQEFIRFSDKEGLLNNYTNSVISDRNNHIWVSHRVGLSRLDENTNAISTIEEKDGLLVTEFIHNSMYRDQDHNIWMGNRNGVTFLNTPDEMFEPKMLETIITDIKIDHRSVDLNAFSKEKEIRGKIPKSLVFPYDHNNLTFDFIALNLKNPKSNLYQFKLEGYEAEWSPIITGNSISYTNLSPGKYTFKVRQSDNPNHWSYLNVTDLYFRINPSWWNTIVARIAFILITILLIYGMIVFRLSRLNRRLKEKQQLYDIADNQNKRLMNYSFITSHNTRSSVGNILGLISAIELDPSNKEYFKMLKDSAQKLNVTIDHINELLNFENAQIENTNCQVLEIINRTIALNNNLIESQLAEISVHIPKDSKISAVPSYLESIFNNILVNALRYGITDTNKKIVIRCIIKNNRVMISFQDYGLGLDLKKYQDKLFKLGSRFHTKKGDGHGMGLFMTKNQVESMGGKILLESKVGVGTTVKIIMNAI